MPCGQKEKSSSLSPFCRLRDALNGSPKVGGHLDYFEPRRDQILVDKSIAVIVNFVADLRRSDK
jgi:hypothetical protein